jgi:hypothetical protein
MPERFNPINGNDGNVIPVTLQQLAVRFNINFLERIFVRAAGSLYLLFRFFTEMTARTREQDNLAFWKINLPIAHQ